MIRLRIGIFTDAYLPYISGLVTSVEMLKKGLEQHGHEVYIVTANLENFHYSYDAKEHVLRVPGVPVGIYDARLTSIYPLQAINTIKEWNLDIIHSQTEFGIGTFARIIAKKFDIPIVHTYHTMYEDYIHYITKGYFINASKKLVEHFTKFYCDKTVTELIVPTKKTYDLFKDKYKVDRNIHIIPTGIDTSRFFKEKFKKEDILNKRKELGLTPDDFVLLFVGRLGKEKSVDYLIDCQKLLRKKENIKLVIVGDGPEKELYEKQVQKNRLKNVIFTGKVLWEDIALYYQIADVFVTASKTETQGLTVIEAMASNLPVVAIKDEAFLNVVIDDLNGYTFTNKIQYKRIIETLLTDKEKYNYIASQARISSEKYSTKYFVEQVLDVYRKALGNRKLKKRSLKDRFKHFFKEGSFEK